jgi:tetratricopeptide (TPR) repeat protein
MWRKCATRALEHYRRAGFPSSTCIGQIAASAYFGPLPARAAKARCAELLETAIDDRAGEATVLAHLGGLEAMLGRFDDAFARLAVARSIYCDLGRVTAVARTCAPIEAQTARLMGDPERARWTLVESCEMLREATNWSHFSTQAAVLADALCALDRYDEAGEWLEEAQNHAVQDDIETELALCPVRSTILLWRGDHGGAEAAARTGVELGAQTDASNLRAACLVSHARALTQLERGAEAAKAFAEARALYEEKENTAAIALLGATAAV